jgi:mannose-6-phosphate isomerase-like protein (cupin superfamily)
MGSVEGEGDVSDYVLKPADHARYDRAKFAKMNLVAGDCLMLGLNCFEPGQLQSTHTHADADKFYLILSGKARMRVGEEIVHAEANDLIWAPAGEPHGVEAALERTVMLVGIAPPPGR